MKIIIQIGQLLLSLSFLIIVHELGHFLLARLFKVRVEKFYLFFDPWFSIFKLKKGETEYGLGWLPLGGYVKISGMIDESMDKEQLKKPPQPYEFRSKPAWQRLLIMLGGVMVNFLIGFLIYCSILFIWGEKYLPVKNITDGVSVDEFLENETGLRTGDKLVSINGKEPLTISDFIEEMFYAGEMVVERNNELVTLQIPKDLPGKLSDDRIHNRGYLITPRNPAIIGAVPDTSYNLNSGLMPKDKVVSVGGVSVKYDDEIPGILDTLKNKTIPITVERNNELVNLEVSINNYGQIGLIFYSLSYNDLERLGYYTLAKKEYTFLESIPAGMKLAKEKIASYLRQFKLIFDFETGAYKGVGGFGAIGGLFPPQWDWQLFWEITGLLSLMLAVLNLLPIPALDGGHVTFLFFEMITGRKPGDKFLEYAQIVGMILLLFLVLYANGNDVYRGILRLIGK